MLKIINLLTILILISFSFLINNNYFKKEEIIKNEIIRENIITKNIIIKKKKEVLNPNLSYLIIDSLNIKNIIVEGTDDNTLNKNVIGIHKASVGLDELGNIILAGHNNKYVFKNLKNISIGDEIKIVTNNKIYKFKVISKDIYKKDNYDYYKNVNDKKILTLITCHLNNDYRLVVVSEFYQ